jgi:hypothetical protein
MAQCVCITGTIRFEGHVQPAVRLAFWREKQILGSVGKEGQ